MSLIIRSGGLGTSTDVKTNIGMVIVELNPSSIKSLLKSIYLVLITLEPNAMSHMFCRMHKIQ